MSTANAGLFPPRVLLVNGVDVAARAVTGVLRASWRARVVSAITVDLLVDTSGVQPTGPAGLPIRRHVLAQVASTLAHAYPPLLIVEATVTSDTELAMITDGLTARGVDVTHVVARMTEDDLHARIHHAYRDPGALRRALQYARRATVEVEVLAADAKIDLTGRTGGHVTESITRVLHRRRWLDDAGTWTTTHPPRLAVPTG